MPNMHLGRDTNQCVPSKFSSSFHDWTPLADWQQQLAAAFGSVTGVTARAMSKSDGASVEREIDRLHVHVS
jgi:hypothetical protein